MAMPNNLLLVRHGESVGNRLLEAMKSGDPVPKELEPWREVDTSRWPLTPEGVSQAKEAGEWLLQECARKGIHPHRFLCSDYARARETAALLGFPGAKWRLEFYLRERDRGKEGVILTKEERLKRFPDSKLHRNRQAFYWRPENGESIADLCMRANRVLDGLWHDADGQDVMIACHEEVMWAFRTRLEKLSPEKYLEQEGDPAEKVRNLQLWHYTRVHPATGEQAPHFTHRIVYDPVAGKTLRTVEIERKTYTNEELLNDVEKDPQIFREPPRPQTI